MRDVFRRAQRANINIYSVDPSGYRGYENYLQNPIRRGGRPAERVANERGASAAAKLRRDFLEITADYTGARAIVNDNDVSAEIDQIFEEAGTYYLLGYQTSNGKPDGRFRRLEIKVNRPGASVRTRSGFYAPKEGTIGDPNAKGMPTQSDLGLTGMMTPAALPLRAAVVPVARTAGPGSRQVDVAVVLTVRLPAVRGALAETVTLVRTLYDAEGRAGPPTPEKIQLTLTGTTGDELRYDLYQRLTLQPGRYSIRLNATSSAIDRSGSVYADIEVPDFTRPALSASAIILGTKPAESDRKDVLAAVVPIVPTSARDFAANDTPLAFVRRVSRRRGGDRAGHGEDTDTRRLGRQGVRGIRDDRRRGLRCQPQRAVRSRAADRTARPRPLSAEHYRHAPGRSQHAARSRVQNAIGQCAVRCEVPVRSEVS